MSFSAHKAFKKTVAVFLLLSVIINISSVQHISSVYAQAPTATPTPASSPKLGPGESEGWSFDPVVTEVGKNAERARELLYWTFSHPARNRAPVLANLWSTSRNIVYLFFLLVLAAGGIGFIVSKRQGRVGPIFSGIASPFFDFELSSFILKVASLLLYVTFSYVFVLGLIEFAQILQNFFIKALGGCNLFNINFGGDTSAKCLFPGDEGYQEAVRFMEKNYSDFVGFRDFTATNQEMANTSLFFVKLTSLTYNAMSIMLILRDVILWFLLIVSPFLALFMPFVFIRNIGWIWIGVFLQWLFYGPLLALFVLGLVKIWEAGIPYGFDFSRAGDCNTPFQTSINILWGGPAQKLHQCNSANYIDTYAEYTISLIMLWAAIFLPWLLLRTFRDYCCDILKQNQATLRAILDKLRTPPPPGAKPGPKPTKTAPAGTATKAMKLPFKRAIEEKRKLVEKRSYQVKIENLKDIKKMETRKLTKAINISMESLRDIAQVETNRVRRLQMQERLSKIANPAQARNVQERQQYERIRSELEQRAAKGDVIAARTLDSVSQARMQSVLQRLSTRAPSAISTARIKQAASDAQVSEQKVAQVVGMLPSISTLSKQQQVLQVAKETGLDTKRAENILNTISQTRPQAIIRRVPRALPLAVSANQIKQTAQKAQVSEESVIEAVRILPAIAQLSSEEQITKVTEQTQLNREEAERVLTALSETSPIKTKTAQELKPKITVEDYEEVKTMWVNHYRNSTIPKSEKIQSRSSWLQEDIKAITNAVNLLQAKDEEMREEGLREVERILPFLLLGGFGDDETIIYLKAKLEAARQVQEEIAKVKEVEERAKTEEETVKVKVGKQEEEEKSMQVQKAKEIKIPEEGKEKGENDQNERRAA